MELPAELRRLVDAPNLAVLATIMPDGSPQATVLWVDREDDLISFNTVEGRVKTRNLRADPRVSLALYDRADPEVAVSLRGRVVEFRHEGAFDHIVRLAGKYRGAATFPVVPGHVRVSVFVEVDSVA